MKKRNQGQELAIIIAEQIENGQLPPFVCSWQKSEVYYPQNFKTKKIYRGLNYIELILSGKYPEFLTFLQVKELGGNVKKGAKGLSIQYCIFTEGEELKKSTYKGTKYYTIFSLEDTEGIDCELTKEFTETELHTRNITIENIINNISKKMNVPIINEGQKACFKLSSNSINMPVIGRFNNIDDYYCILFHELAHATGKNGINRVMGHRIFDPKEYAQEELIAEISSFMICNRLGISNNNEISQERLAYIKGWSSLLRDKPEALKLAVNYAEKITEFILDDSNIELRAV